MAQREWRALVIPEETVATCEVQKWGTVGQRVKKQNETGVKRRKCPAGLGLPGEGGPQPNPVPTGIQQAPSQTRMASLVEGALLVVWHGCNIFCEHFWETGEMQHSQDAWPKQSSKHWNVTEWALVSSKRELPKASERRRSPSQGTEFKPIKREASMQKSENQDRSSLVWTLQIQLGFRKGSLKVLKLNTETHPRHSRPRAENSGSVVSGVICKHLITRMEWALTIKTDVSYKHIAQRYPQYSLNTIPAR